MVETRTWFILSGVVSLASLSALGYFIYQYRNASNQRSELQTNAGEFVLEGKESGPTPEINNMIRDYKSQSEVIAKSTNFMYISGGIAAAALFSTLYFYKKHDDPSNIKTTDLEPEPVADNSPLKTLETKEKEPSLNPEEELDDDFEDELITTSF